MMATFSPLCISKEMFFSTVFSANDLHKLFTVKTILPEWRDRYSPEVTENVEHLWYLEVAEIPEVTLNAAEHAACRWVSLEEAIETVDSWTNREAFERLR